MVSIASRRGDFTVMSTWAGPCDRRRASPCSVPPLHQFVGEVLSKVEYRTAGQAVFLSATSRHHPAGLLLQNVRHNKTLHERVYLLTVRTGTCAAYSRRSAIGITLVQEGLYQVIARCGFMETPDIPRVLSNLLRMVMCCR